MNPANNPTVSTHAIAFGSPISRIYSTVYGINNLFISVGVIINSQISWGRSVAPIR